MTVIKFTYKTPYKFMVTQSGLAKGDKGDTGEIAFTTGAKSTATDAGTFGDVSLTDDYVYVCVQTGTTGNAIWKKAVLFAT
jgi:hypothetical protein